MFLKKFTFSFVCRSLYNYIIFDKFPSFELGWVLVDFVRKQVISDLDIIIIEMFNCNVSTPQIHTIIKHTLEYFKYSSLVLHAE